MHHGHPVGGLGAPVVGQENDRCFMLAGHTMKVYLNAGTPPSS